MILNNDSSSPQQDSLEIELLALLDEVAAQTKPGPPPLEMEERYWQAHELPDGEARSEALQNLVADYPGHVAAWLELTDHLVMSPHQRVEVLRRLVEIGRRGLDPAYFELPNAPFWMDMDSRPYMRARFAYGDALIRLDRVEDGLAEWLELLRLNPNDNQGIRYEVLPMLLQLDRRQEAAALFERYNEADFSAVFAWCRVLDRWLDGNFEDATAALETAREQNPHIEAYLLGKRRPPKRMPVMYSPGSIEEAKSFAERLLSAWKAWPKARAWLRKQQPSGGK